MWPLIDLIQAQQSMEHWTFVGARRGMGDGDVREQADRTPACAGWRPALPRRRFAVARRGQGRVQKHPP